MGPSQQTCPPEQGPCPLCPDPASSPHSGLPAWQVALPRITDHVAFETISAFDLTKNFKHKILPCGHFKQFIEINL